MSFDVRVCAGDEEFAGAFMAIGQYFGAELKPEAMARWSRLLERERMHAAHEDGRIVGGAGAFSFDFSVPGGSVPTAGITLVGVYPTHRRRGMLRALMRAQLDDIHRRGEPLAALWASEETIYGRYGYGMASLAGEIAVPRERVGFALPFAARGRVRLVEREEALERFPPIWERVRRETPGMFERPGAWWEGRTLYDPEERREGGGPKRLALLELDGEAAGYGIYRHHPAWEGGVATGRVNVIEAIADAGHPTQELWRYLLDIDWTATITARLLPVDHPLLLLLAEPRRTRFRLMDALWVRLVDVGAALGARDYDADGDLVFDVADAFCPWNEGRWRLGDGAAERTDDDPDLRLDVAALGSAYLGGFTFAQLARAGRVEELRDGAVARADRRFRADRAPWCPEIF